MKRSCSAFFLGVLALLASAGTAAAWHGPGHDLVTKSAVAALPEDMPAFFRNSPAAIAHHDRDPDLLREEKLTGPQLAALVSPNHYLDVELLEGRAWPDTRYEMIALCCELKLEPEKVGLLPYAIAEMQQRLVLAFAEHRRWPDDPEIQAKCRLYAGQLSHYAADLCMPLHTTIHYNGRVAADGTRTQKGIHERVDALLQKLDVEPAAVAAGIEPQPLGDLMPAIHERFDASHALVDRAYELDAAIPKLADPLGDDPTVRAFARQRLDAAAELVASLYVTAWRDSAGVELPEWHDRPAAPLAGEAVADGIEPTDSTAKTGAGRSTMMVVAIAALGLVAVGLLNVRRRRPRQ